MEGRILAGRYELTGRLGSGGMAAVWHARDRTLARDVAVKLLHPSLAEIPAYSERFRREARNAAALSHPNIVAIYDTGTDDDTPYIVMELVEGTSLHELLRSRGPLPVERTARVGRAVLAALAHAHARGLVHRDVKPGNVLIASDGTMKVADFGIAKGLAEATELTQTGTLIGTASYLSPEQAGGGRATASSDLYALGCLLYECLAGSPPFSGDNPVAVAVQHRQAPVPSIRDRRPDVPQDLAAALERALAKDPAARFSSAGGMDAAIAATGLAEAPDRPAELAATTVDLSGASTAAVHRGAEPTERIGAGATTPLPSKPPPPDRVGRALRILGVALLLAAAAWLVAFAFTSGNRGTSPPDTSPSPTSSPVAPGAVGSPEPSPTPSPSPTPTPEETRGATPGSPKAPRTPRLDLPGLEANEPSEPTPEPTPEQSPSP